MVHNTAVRKTAAVRKEAVERREILARHEAEELYEIIAKSSPVSIYIVQDGRFCFVNPQFQKTSGYSEEELLGLPPLELVHPEDRQRVRDHAIAMLKGQINTPCEFRVFHRDGEIRWGVETTTPVTYRGRRASLGNLIDITESKQAERLLLEKEERYRAIFEQGLVSIVLINPENEALIDFNDKACESLGYSREEFAKLKMNDIDTIGRTKENGKKHTENMFKEGAEVFETKHRTKDGDIRDVIVSAKTFINNGKPYALCVFQDITKRKRMEEKLHQSEEFSSSLLGNAPNPIEVVNLDMSTRYVNKAFEELTGFTSAEVVGRKPPYLWWPEEPKKELGDAIEKDLADFNLPGMAEINIRKETVFQNKKGERLWAELSIVPVKHDGKTAYLLANWVDISQRKQMERGLRESEEKFSKAFRSSPEAIAIVSEKDRKFVDVNDSYTQITGYSREELIGNTPPSGLICASPEGHTKMDKMMQEQGRFHNEEFDYRTKSGEIRMRLFSLEPITLNGEPCRIGVSVDITERKKMEEQLKRHAEELQAANEKLRELDKMKDSFLSTVSHELRTPLTSIKSFAEILLTYDEDKETQKEFLNIINQESDRLTKLINDFLDLAKIEAGRMQWDNKEQSLVPIAQNAINITQALAKEKNLTVEFNASENLPVVSCDKDRLVQVVTNLLSNSIKFTPIGGKIRVGIKAVAGGPDGSPGTVVVSVADNGIGIAPENHEAVFEKFKQVGDTLTDKPKGTGLGLPICKEIIEHYGGKIWVESELGKGAVFLFSLPTVPLAEVKAPEPPVAKEKPVEQIQEGKIILIVDDEENIRQFLAHELTKKGYHVIEASNGKEALNLARERHPDLITLDVQMPDISGFDVTTVLKNDDETKDIPILILSVIEDKFKAYKLGANDCMTKPFENEELVARINQLLIGTKKTVLIVDDDKSLVKSVKYHLDHKGYSTLVAYDGKEAMEMVESHRPDLIVLDIIMPNMDGYEVIKALKSNPETANLPVVLVTGIEIDGGRVRALQMGATDFLAKSGDFSKLYEMIDNILASKASEVSA